MKRINMANETNNQNITDIPKEIDENQIIINRTKEYLFFLELENNKLKNKNKRVENKNKSLEIFNQKLHKRNDGLFSTNNRLDTQFKSVISSNKKMKNKIKKLDKSLDSYKMKNRELKKKNLMKEKEIKNLKNSASWKITKPLRIIKLYTSKIFHN